MEFKFLMNKFLQILKNRSEIIVIVKCRSFYLIKILKQL